MKNIKKRLLISVVSFTLLISLIFSIPIPAAAANNSIKSPNDLHLKLCVDWETDYSPGNDFVSVTAKVYLEHKALFVGARNNGVVSINGNAKTFSTPAIRQESQKQSMPLLATHTVQIPYKSGEKINADIYAKWYFGGILSGVNKVEWLEVAGKFTFDGTNANVTPGGTIPKTESNTVINSNTANNATTVDSNDAMGGPITSQRGEIKSNTGTYINLRAVWTAYDSLTTDGMLTYAVELYLDYYSLQMRAHNGGKLTVGNNTVNFNIPGIQENGNTKHSILLTTATYEAKVGETVNIKANFPYNGVYGGVQIGEITLSVNVSVK